MPFAQMYKCILIVLTILFSISNVSYAADKAVCKYVDSLKQSPVINFNAELFRNVDGIYVLPILSTHKALLEHPFLNGQSLMELVKCQLKVETAIPVNSNESSVPILKRKELLDPQNIIIWVALDINDTSLVSDDFDIKIVTLVVTYNREGIHNIKAMQEQCSVAFPLYEDKDKVLKSATQGIKKCLSKPYHTNDTEGVDPDFLKAIKVN